MELITLTKENLAQEHICCAIAKNNDPQVCCKKQWLAQQMDAGLVFCKCAVRGKCFIEYLPAENAWAPIEAEGYMYIDCFWVSGSLKGKGYAKLLLQHCIEDSRAKGKKGLVVLSSKKKKPYLSDPAFLARQGFQTADTAPQDFVLLHLPLTADAAQPRFRAGAKTQTVPQQGFVLYYTAQCPFTAKYVPLAMQVAAKHQVPLQVVHLTTAQEAQNAPTPFTTYSLFYNGKLVTHEILSEKKLEKIFEEKSE